MQYLGGKSKIAKWLVAAMRPRLAKRAGWWDAFCGGLSVSVELSKIKPGLVTDASLPLISLYQAVARGWDPPVTLSEDEYKQARQLPDEDPRKAFAGFGCSFGGKWFGGYARKDPKDALSVRGYASQTRNAVLEQVRALSACEIARVDFLSSVPRPVDLVIYLDPPYQGTTSYAGVPPFDHARFYEVAKGWARAGADVFVSEYSCPIGECVMEFSHDMRVAGGAQKDARVERLYRL